jgi:hypothetical protein
VTTSLSAFMRRIEVRPWLAALVLGTVFLLTHLLNCWIYDLFRVGSLYLVGYVISRDILLGINSGKWFASTAFVVIVFSFFYFVVLMLGKRESFLLVTLIVLMSVLVLLSIPLFPEAAFHK